jgi:glycosyltransferase involved in cell wall biosynthesis
VDLQFDPRPVRHIRIGPLNRPHLSHIEDAAARHDLTLAVLAGQDTLPALRTSTEVVVASPASAAMYSVAEQLAWRRAFEMVRPRAVWLPHYPFPLARLLPGNRRMLTFATVHDTIHVLPRSISGQSWAYRVNARAKLSAGARSCRRIFTPSEATAATVTAIVRSARVQVTPIPVDEVWLDPVDPKLSPVDGRYLLYVGNTKRYKNLPLLLEAFSDLPETIPHKLVIAGGGATVRTLDDRVRRLAEDNGDRVVLMGQIDFAALRALVASADLLIMPSLYEGAGLPPLEAMASRTAVLSSDIPVLRETCGDGADYFDPHDRGALARLMGMYCNDDMARDSLAVRGHSYVLKRQQQICPTLAADTICAELVANRP